MKRSLSLSLLILLSVLSIKSTAQKKYNSLFWEITGNGLSKPSYLYGTMHVSNKVAFHLSDSFFVAIKNVDVVGLETNPENWMQEIYGETLNALEVSKNMPQSNSSFYKNCFYLNIPENKDLKGVLKYHPLIVNSLLYRKNDSEDNFEENTYLDLFIMQCGRKYGKDIASLEDYKESQMLVDMAAESINENEEDHISYQKKSKLLKGSSYFDVIEDSYRKGDLDFMDSLSRVFYPSKNYQKYMIEMRNENMVKSMDSIMKSRSLFTGVGAAHLPGDKGVISLLRQKGYTVRPIFLNSELESSYKEEVEKMNHPVSFQSFTDKDSLFTADVPGKMYEIAKTKSYRYYLYPDMANGCFYMIMMVQNYSGLLGVKPSDYMLKLDSLLFENIPGKILKKTPLTTSDGWNGYLIENQTKRGDYQYYKIFFSPTSLLIAKVNGNSDYAKGKEAQRFLNSVQFHEQKSKTFHEHKFSDIGTNIYMPSNIQIQRGIDYNYKTFAHFIASGIDENNKQYVFMRSSYFDFYTLEEDTFELNMLAESFCKEQNMKLLSKKILTKDKLPSIQFNANYGNKEFYGKIVLAQPYYYMLLSSAKDKNSDKFFHSLTLENMDPGLPLETYIDSSLYFKVNTFRMENKEKKYLSAYEEKPYLNTKKDPEPKKYYFSRTHYFYSPYTSECIKIEANRFSKYSNSENVDTFWVRRAQKYTYRDDLILKDKKVTKLSDRQEGYFLYADTNTNEIIRIKAILKGEMIYVIHSNTDSSKQHSSFSTSFFNSFEPMDTVFGTSIFESKAKLFFSDLYSDDKATWLGAQKASEDQDVDFLPQDDTCILSNIKNPKFNKLSLKCKANILRGLGESKDSLMPFKLGELYNQYTDSTEIQLVLLQTIADFKSKASTSLLLDLLINDTPPLESAQEANDIFFPYYDSLELTKFLFPKLLELTRYAEYKQSIHKLLADAVYNNILTKEDYINYKPFLFKECKDELRRQFSSEKESNNYSDYSLGKLFSNSYYDPYVGNYENDWSFTEGLSGNKSLFELYTLILPFNKESQAHSLINKMQNLSDPLTKSNIIAYYLHKGISFPDSVIRNLSVSEEGRCYWYERLKDIDSLQLFEKKYLTQRSFSHAMLFGNMKLDEKEDTVIFIERRKVSYKNDSGYAYFYKLKRKDDNKFSIYACGLFPYDENKLITSDHIFLHPKEIDKGDKENELIDEMVEQLRTKNRSRVGYNSYY